MQYSSAKQIVQNVKKDTNKREKGKEKEEHAKAWIEYIAALFADVGYGENNSNKKYVPYDTFTEFYEEYEHYHRYENKDIRRRSEMVTAAKETFRKAFISLKDTVKLRTAKGSFETCSVCNNLNDCLKNTGGEWTKSQIDLVLRLKRLHLLQQSEERLDSNKRKAAALYDVDRDGNYTSMYLEIDGFTEFKTKTPIQSGGRRSKGDAAKQNGNRVIGVVFACGQFNTRFVYTLNDLTRGGANIMIEVVRQALYDAGQLFASVYQIVPKQFSLQFDNCGENKVSDSLYFITFVILIYIYVSL